MSKLNHKITVAGIGPGAVEYISPLALLAIKSAKILIGGRRALSEFAHEGQIIFPITGNIKLALEFIEEKLQVSDVTIMVSGDPGYYSMLDVLRREFDEDIIEVIPSISAMQLAFARLKLPWHGARLLSFHGRRPADEELKYERGKIIGMLTDENFNSHTIPEILIANGWNKQARLDICSRLSYPDEKIITTTLEQSQNIDVVKHGILILRGEADDRD